MDSIDIQATKDKLINWLRVWFKENGPDSPAVIGMSGGKDSTVAAALLVEALGAERVIGVMMPNGEQSDLQEARKICEWLGIKTHEVNIGAMFHHTFSSLVMEGINVSDQAYINIAPRLRMTTLYAIAQSANGRVINTSNYSEIMIGWSTRWGDSVGDMSPLGFLTCGEVVAIGDALGIPEQWVHKAPADGLTGKTDEDNFGFTYEELDKWLSGEKDSLSENVCSIIEEKVSNSQFKRDPIPRFSNVCYQR